MTSYAWLSAAGLADDKSAATGCENPLVEDSDLGPPDPEKLSSERINTIRSEQLGGENFAEIEKLPSNHEAIEVKINRVTRTVTTVTVY